MDAGMHALSHMHTCTHRDLILCSVVDYWSCDLDGYFTISGRGVMNITKGEESEIIPLVRWQKECELFKKLREVK